MTKPQEALAAIVCGVVTAGIGKLPLPGARLVYLPGVAVAILLGGSLDEPGWLSERTIVVVIVTCPLSRGQQSSASFVAALPRTGLPNMRLQPTRSSPSARHSPQTREPPGSSLRAAPEVTDCFTTYHP
jgi:hypothetical protein